MFKYKIFLIMFIIVIGGIAFFSVVKFDLAYTPPERKIINPKENDFFTGFSSVDKTGERLLHEDLLPSDRSFLELGKQVFYQETFGNETFFTDIMGILDGPFTLMNVAKAILALRGEGTSNLQVELAEDVVIGGTSFKKGQKIDTGIDVVKGAYIPLGTKLSFSEGRVKMGVTCTACHATVDRDTGFVIEGAPNTDFNVGLLLALATNSAAYFTHTDIKSLEDYVLESSKKITNAREEVLALPDIKSLEDAVDKSLLKWPKGYFDTTIDLENNPTQNPDAYTLGDFPYGWSGFAAVGPFKGLSTFSSNVNAQNTDPLSQAEISEELFDIDNEVYIGTLLQNAANEKYRYDPDTGVRPSQFLQSIDKKNPEIPGFNELIKNPEYPKSGFFTPSGFLASSPGYNVGEQVYAMSAYQNLLRPPEIKRDKHTLEIGERVFERANCLSCHSGFGYTNNQIIPVLDIGTEPSRAKALKQLEGILDKTRMYAPETSVPLPENPEVLGVDFNSMTKEDLQLAFALGESAGGYKVKGLIGLQWSAPYLHDGGVAIGPDITKDFGIPGTLSKGILPDPNNSLLALIDRNLRQKVVEANRIPELKAVHVTGEGHEYWVDEAAGFTKEEQEALVEYLLSLQLSEKNN